ncbi:MAG: RHS repeat protein, partial [Planctomycetales bacterium]|nr:RHS repeat protein [Planctomycetales bacterium]
APTAMLGIGVENAAFAPSEDGLVASAKISRGSYSFAVPGDGPDNQHYWSLPAGESTISAGLPVEMSTQPTGVYKYEIQASSGRVLRDTNGDISVREATELSGRFAIVNSVTSVFGAGWGLAGLQEVIEGPDNSLLLIDGDGSQTIFGGQRRDPTPPPVEEPPPAAAAAIVAEAEGGVTTSRVFASPLGDYSVAEKMSDGSFRRMMTDQTEYQFNAAGKLVSTRLRTGQETRFEYDANGRIQRIIDPAGLETTFTYTGSFVSEITDPAGRITRLEHDSAGDLVKVTYPDDTVATFEYNRHLVVASVDAEGNRYEFQYDAANRLIGIQQPDGGRQAIRSADSAKLAAGDTTNRAAAPLASSSEGTRAFYSDGAGRTTAFSLDRAGQLAAESDGAGAKLQQQRDV